VNAINGKDTPCSRHGCAKTLGYARGRFTLKSEAIGSTISGSGSGKLLDAAMAQFLLQTSIGDVSIAWF